MCRMPCLLLVLVILISYQISVTGSPITTYAPMTTNEPETGPEIKCGVRSSIKIEREPELSPKINGGYPVYIQDWPWIVSFRDESNKHFCGGTIISENFILTAAHCFIATELRYRKISSLHVSVGSDWLNTTIKHPIDKVIIHDKYNPYYNDIALVKLKEPLNFNDTVRPICLPGLSSSFGHNVSFLNATAATAGWGRTEMAYESAFLKGLNLTVKLNSYCNETFSSLKNEIPQEITENQLCAEGNGGDSCNGDSGGPLITNGPQDPETNQTIIYQIGIVSYGAECYVSGYPGVYTRITNYIPWINEQLTK